MYCLDQFIFISLRMKKSLFSRLYCTYCKEILLNKNGDFLHNTLKHIKHLYKFQFLPVIQEKKSSQIFLANTACNNFLRQSWSTFSVKMFERSIVPCFLSIVSAYKIKLFLHTDISVPICELFSRIHLSQSDWKYHR